MFFRNAVVSPERDYEYDDLYRLRSAQGRELAGTDHTTAAADRRPPLRDLPDPAAPGDLAAVVRYAEDYSYDDGGNFTVLTHRQLVIGGASWTRAMTPEAGGNRLTKVDVSGAAIGSEPPAYDGRGNLNQLGRLTFTTGWASRTVRATISGNVTAHYQYDAAGRRVRKVVVKGNRVEQRRYVGSAELATVTVGGAIQEAHETLRVETGGGVLAMLERPTTVAGAAVDRSPLIRYQLADLLGSTSLELDDAGAPISYEELHPYGTTAYESARPGAGVSLKRYRFAGQERDDETGLDYSGARYYSPWLGRWTAPDPAGLAEGTNAYCYVRGRPTHLVDPSGRGGDPPELGFWEGIGVVAQEAAVQLGNRGQALAMTVYPPLSIYATIKAGAAIVDRYQAARAAPLPATPAGAAVTALNDVLNPLAHSAEAFKRAERAKRGGDPAANIRARVAGVASLADFAFIVAAGAKAGPRPTGAAAEPPVAGAPEPVVPAPKAPAAADPVAPPAEVPAPAPAAPPPTPAPTPEPPPTPAPAADPPAAPTMAPGPAAPAPAAFSLPAEPSIWGQGNVIQGRGAEAALAPRTPGTHFYGNFPRFDRGLPGPGGPSAPAVEVGQLKAIDTAKTSYQGKRLTTTIEAAAGDIGGVGESTWEGGGHTMTIGPETLRVLDVAIPETPLTAAQEAAIAAAIEGSASMGVEVRIHRVH